MLAYDAMISQPIDNEIYLPAFWAATQAACHVSSVLFAVPQAPSTASTRARTTHLLHQALDQRWKFPGFVTSDYGVPGPTPPLPQRGRETTRPLPRDLLRTSAGFFQEWHIRINADLADAAHAFLWPVSAPRGALRSI